MRTADNRKSRLLRSQQGLSLIELMISLTIGLVLLMGISTLILQQSSSRNELEKTSRQIENGRYAMQILGDAIQLAGYYGEYAQQPPVPAALPDPCDITAAGLTAGIALPVQGYDVVPTSAAGSPIACLPTANYLPGTDILVVRRAATTPATGNVTINPPARILLQSTMSSFVLSPATAAFAIPAYSYTAPTGYPAGTAIFPAPFTLLSAVGGNLPATLRDYLVQIYFISPCSVMANGATCQATDDNGSPIPTLKRLDITAGNYAIPPALPTPVPLVEGIENMQFEYGLDTDPAPGDGYPNNYCSDPDNPAAASCPTSYPPAVPATPPTNWPNVMSVRINLLARNIECTTGYADTKTYDLGIGASGVVPVANCTSGGYLRHVFNGLVRIINPSNRRAMQ